MYSKCPREWENMEKINFLFVWSSCSHSSSIHTVTLESGACSAILTPLGGCVRYTWMVCNVLHLEIFVGLSMTM